MAALVWVAGVIVLLLKSSSMIMNAVEIGAPVSLAVTAVIIGLAAGAIKAKYLFVRVCNKNIERICALKSPKIWQFYRIRFFFFLFLMITFGNFAYRVSSGNLYMLLALAALELSISTALFISAKCFRNRL